MRKLTIKDLEKNISKYKYKKISLEELHILNQYFKIRDIYDKYFDECNAVGITCYKISEEDFYAAYIINKDEVNKMYSHYHWWTGAYY